MKQFFRTKIVPVIIYLMIALSVSIVSVGGEPAQSAVAAVPDVSEVVRDIGEEAELYNPVDDELHRRAIDKPGIGLIQTVIFQVLDVVKYALGALAVLMLTVLGIRMTVTSKSEEAITEAKNHFIYALTGFAIVMVAGFAVANVFFGSEGEILANEESARFFAGQGSLQVQRIYSALEFFIGVLAVLTIIINGFRMVTSAGEEIDERKKAIQWAVVGLVIVGLSELVVKDIIFANHGSTLNIPGAIDLIIVISNFITGFTALIAVALIIYAGIQFVISFVSEGSNEKGKKALIAAIIGMIIVAGSYALTTTMITFQG